MKRTLTFLLVLVLCFSLIAEIGVSASAASVTYYPKYTGSSGSIVDGLRAVGVDSSYSNRSKIAALNGIANYSGTASQNTQMLNLLKQGKLIKSKTADSGSVTYYPRYTGSSGSIVDGLNAVGADSSYSSRSKIAALNGIANYSGTASQNTQMLNLLKQGKLIKSKSGSTPAPAPAPAPAGGLITNSSYNVSVSNRAKENRPHYECPSNARSAANYNTVINQFNVTSNPRYQRTSSATWCNIFAWDVMSAMQVKLPHWVKGGVPASSTTSGATELNANATYNWLNNYGSQYGWKKVSAADAQNAANAGKPTIAIWKNTSGGSGHVAVVRPAGNGYAFSAAKGPVIAQAGASNYNYANVSTGFGSSRMSAVVYWTHA